MQEKQLIIIGTGLFGEVAKAYFEEYTQYRVGAFACHEKYKDREAYCNVPLISIENIYNTHPPGGFDVFVAIGYAEMNKRRAAVFCEMKDKGYKLATFIHPDVKIWSSTHIGDNVFIFEDNTIQPFTSIGNDTVLWSGNHIGHHSKIGNHTFISSHVVVSGSCVIGNNVFIGVNATLRDGVRVADETLIGSSSVIMKDTKEKEVYMSERTKPHRVSSDRLRF